MLEVTRKGFKDKEGNKVHLSAKVANATAGNLAGIDADGYFVDSGKKPSDFADANHSHTGIEKSNEYGRSVVSVDVDGDPIDGGGEIHFSLKKGNGSDLPKDAAITPENIDNFIRALHEPSKEAPEGGFTGANKLITSKAVYDAMVLKVDKLSYSDTSAFFASSDVIDTIYETGVYILIYTPTTENPATPHMLQVRHYLEQPAPNSAYVNMVEQCLIDKDGIRIRTCVCDVDGVPSGTWSSWS